MNPYKKLLLALLSLAVFIGLGTAGFYFIEGYTPLDAFAVTVGLLSTTSIGYGTMVPGSLSGKLLTLVMIIIGVSMVGYAFGTVISLVLEGHLTNVLGRSKMEKKISGRKDHIILCGAGRVGRQVLNRLRAEKVPFVIIDKNEDIIEALKEEGLLVINDDASKDEVLQMAGISRAKGLIAALPSDADNVFVTLTSKELNPAIVVVARADVADSKPKLIRAGADKVVSPSVIGGRRMAISILKPVSVDFVETLIHSNDIEFELEEIVISATSSLVGKMLKDSQIKQKTGTMVVAIKRNEAIITNPDAEEVIEKGDMLIAIGTRLQLAKLEEMASVGEVL